VEIIGIDTSELIEGNVFDLKWDSYRNEEPVVCSSMFQVQASACSLNIPIESRKLNS
jgi:hypothetical protein